MGFRCPKIRSVAVEQGLYRDIVGFIGCIASHSRVTFLGSLITSTIVLWGLQLLGLCLVLHYSPRQSTNLGQFLGMQNSDFHKSPNQSLKCSP